MDLVGTSWMIDFSGIKNSSLHQANNLQQLLLEAANYGDLTILKSSSHQFAEQINSSKAGGATAFVLLAESHLSAHTWPEFDRIVIDLFSCGNVSQGQKIIDFLLDSIGHDEVEIEQISRGG